jgi:hypothetical protein
VKIFIAKGRKMGMYRRSGYSKHWNIFARELAAILAVRNLRLETLSEQSAIFPDKVRRLAQSLSEAGSFPVLNADEMAVLIRTFHLSNDEVLQLKAALLATALEKMLMAHIDQEAALSIADAVFRQLLPAVRRADEEANDPDAKRGDLSLNLDNTNDRALNAACRSFDSAEIALNLSLGATSSEERIDNALYACQLFEQALRDLDAAEEQVRRTQGWRNWRSEIQRRLAVARAHL